MIDRDDLACAQNGRFFCPLYFRKTNLIQKRNLAYYIISAKYPLSYKCCCGWMAALISTPTILSGWYEQSKKTQSSKLVSTYSVNTDLKLVRPAADLFLVELGWWSGHIEWCNFMRTTFSTTNTARTIWWHIKFHSFLWCQPKMSTSGRCRLKKRLRNLPGNLNIFLRKWPFRVGLMKGH